MSLNYHQMVSLLKEIKESIINRKLLSITMVHPLKFVLELEADKNLLICLKEPFLRFHLTCYQHKDHPSFFSNELKKHLQGYVLTDCQLINFDRVLELSFVKNDIRKTLMCDFVPKKTNCYLIDVNKKIILSLMQSKSDDYQFPEKMPLKDIEEANLLFNREVDKNYYEQEELLKFKEKKEFVRQDLNRSLKVLSRQLMKFENDYNEALKWEDVQHRAKLIQANLFAVKDGLEKIEVFDWETEKTQEIHLDSSTTPQEMVDNLYQKSKKLKKAIPHLENQILKNKKQQDKVVILLEVLEKIENSKNLKEFCQKNHLKFETIPKANQKTKQTLPFREYITENKLKIWVGKSALDNDLLTFKYANGSDYWLHVNGMPGSHVVIHLDKNKTLDEESLKDALQLALHYSKAKNSKEAEVCLTQCKHVSRFGKNTPGKVQVSNIKNYYVKEDRARLNQLLTRNQ